MDQKEYERTILKYLITFVDHPSHSRLVTRVSGKALVKPNNN